MKRVIKLQIRTIKDGKECGLDCPYIRVNGDCHIFGGLNGMKRSPKCKSHEVKPE